METWVWLGTQDDPKLEITDPQANANERLTIATLYDSQPWDAKWLMNTYHLLMQPPPENWQTMTDENEKQAILNGLSKDMNGGDAMKRASSGSVHSHHYPGILPARLLSRHNRLHPVLSKRMAVLFAQQAVVRDEGGEDDDGTEDGNGNL